LKEKGAFLQQTVVESSMIAQRSVPPWLDELGTEFAIVIDAALPFKSKLVPLISPLAPPQQFTDELSSMAQVSQIPPDIVERENMEPSWNPGWLRVLVLFEMWVERGSASGLSSSGNALIPDVAMPRRGTPKNRVTRNPARSIL
jgi:hypothetical protein